jgi:hypothetical protein
MPSKLLIDEYPLVFQPTLAVLTSLNEAVVLQQLHYWLKNNAGKPGHLHDGRVWCWNTYKDWRQGNFPFWSESTIKRAFSDLRKRGLVIKGNYNRVSFDRTGWYTIDYEALEELHPSGQDELIRQIILTPSSGQHDETIPETTAETTTYIPAAKSAAGEQPISSAAPEVGTTECEIPAGLNEKKSKELRHRCTCCDEKDVIGWGDEECPNCGAVIVWIGNKWLERKEWAKGKDQAAGRQHNFKHSNPAITFAQELCGAKASQEEIESMLKYLSANGQEAFEKMCHEIHTADSAEGKFGRGILRHIANTAPYYGKSGQKKFQQSIESRGQTPAAPSKSTAATKLPSEAAMESLNGNSTW